MKKSIFETVEVFACALFLVAVIELCTGATPVGLINSLADIAITTAVILILDDFFFKFNRYRKLIVWQYWAGVAFELAAVVSFAVARNTTSWLWTWLGLAGCAAFVAAVIVWDLKIYNIITLNPNEYETMLWEKHLRTFSKLDEAAIAADLEGFLRFRFVDDRPESGLDFDRPFDPAAVETLAEMKAARDALMAKATAPTITSAELTRLNEELAQDEKLIAEVTAYEKDLATKLARKEG